MLLALRHPRVWLAMGWLLVFLATIASIVPLRNVPKPPGVTDKMEHAVAYGLLAIWFAGIYPRSRYVMIGIGLFLMGIAIEWAQSAMQLGRESDFRDVVANSIGIVAGLTLALIWLGGWAQRVEGWTRKS
ncbi:MAG: VanZ family protein [Steroidobacteraceae bacterium]